MPVVQSKPGEIFDDPQTLGRSISIGIQNAEQGRLLLHRSIRQIKI